jgi:hypothetical protein
MRVAKPYQSDRSSGTINGFELAALFLKHSHTHARNDESSHEIIIRTFQSDKKLNGRDSAAFDMTLTQDSVERPLDAY